MEKLLKEVLKKITPTEEEYEREKKIVEVIFREIKKFKLEPVLVGSLAKRTDLRGDKDIDILIKFHKDVSREELEKKGLEIGKKIFTKLKAKYEIDYAEHPYVLGNYKGYNVEIVPCYDTKKPKSAVDRTPFHTEYIQKKIKNKEALRKEIRLLKQFMKGIDVYGAEAKIQGFSGYLTELLVINYNSFINALKAATEWSSSQVLDPENLWEEDKESAKYFFSGAPFIVIDPVDKDRNVAAAVSKEKLSEFIVSAREFLKLPKIEFFFPKKKEVPKIKELKDSIKKRETKIIAILLKHKKINPNALYSQLRKTKSSIENFLEKYKFKILKSAEWSNEISLSTIIFEFEVFSLPRVEFWVGPPIYSQLKEQENFLKKYKNAYIEGDRWVVDRDRKIQKVEDLIKKILKERKGFGKNLIDIKTDFLINQEILKIKDKSFLIFFKEKFLRIF